METSVARSYLFVPGNRPDRFERACSAGAHAVIVDLEDAVPPSQKVAARAALAAWLSPARPVLVRVNAADSEWFKEDLALCRKPGVAGVVLPKTEWIGADVIELCSDRERVILPFIETATGLERAREVAACPGVQRLLFGSLDFQIDLGIDGDGEELLFFRSQLVLASRLAGVQPPVDGVCTAIDDLDQIKADTLRARRLGFGGKLCIHPRQVPLVNAGFAPSALDAAWAQRVLAAAEKSSGGAVAVDGRMVDRPVILKAERIVREASKCDSST